MLWFLRRLRTYLELNNSRPSTCHTFIILSSQLVVRYFDEESRAAHRIGPDFKIASFSDPSKWVVEWMTFPVLSNDMYNVIG